MSEEVPQRLRQWEQQSPKDQAVVLLQAIEGWAGNMRHDHVLVRRGEAEICNYVDQLRELCAKYMSNIWEESR